MSYGANRGIRLAGRNVEKDRVSIMLLSGLLAALLILGLFLSMLSSSPKPDR